MKAIIRLYMNDTEIFPYYNKFSDEYIENLRIAINDWAQIYIKEAYSNFTKSYEGVLFNIDNDFLYKHGNKKISINPMNFNQDIQIVLEYAGDDNWICYCKEIYCPGGCGTLRCGCVDVCLDRCGEDNSWW